MEHQLEISTFSELVIWNCTACGDRDIEGSGFFRKDCPGVLAEPFFDHFKNHPEKTCERCGGEGWVDNDDVDGVFVTQLQKTCPACRGKGTLDLPPCPKCGGNGLNFPETGSGWFNCVHCKGRGYFYLDPLLPVYVEALPDFNENFRQYKKTTTLRYLLTSLGSPNLDGFYVVAKRGKNLWGLYVTTEGEEVTGQWTFADQDQIRCWHLGGNYYLHYKPFEPTRFSEFQKKLDFEFDTSEED